MAWLDDNPPARSQFRCPRRAPLSGQIVVHTAESVMDTVGPDTGAEAVARFIQTRDTPGSYHDLVDSDSTITLVRWTCEAYQDATGSNPHALSISFACSYLDWPKMSPTKRNLFLNRGVASAVAMARMVKADRGITIPPRRLTRAESEMGRPGFIDHSRRDPARRKDPGSPEFPWAIFLLRYAQAIAPTPTPPPGDNDMPAAMFYDDPKTDGTYMVSGGKVGLFKGTDVTELQKAAEDANHVARLSQLGADEMRERFINT